MSERMMQRLKPGDTVPQFECLDIDGRVFSSADLIGKRTVIFFYPAAFSPGCTKEICEFRERKAVFADLGYELVGISPDSPEKIRAWQSAYRTDFRMLADPSKTVHRLFGITKFIHPMSLLGNGRSRSTFVVESDGTLSQAMYSVNSMNHTNQLISALQAAVPSR